MNIAIDISPLSNGHSIRGTGFYLTHLKETLLKYIPENSYHFFSQGEKLPENIDLIHFPYFDPFFLTLPLWKKYKTVVTVHDLTPLVFPKYFPIGIKGSLKWQMQKFSLQQVDAIITDSNASKKDIERICGIPGEKIHVIYLAAGENFIQIGNKEKEIVRQKYKLPEKFVLYVGDATANKNLPRLLEAVKKISVPLIVVGKTLADTNIDKENLWNKDLVKVQKIMRENSLVHLLGFVSNQELVALYNSASAFVMPSLYEGFGLPILEAMSCGCPVITTKEGSILEVAGKAAEYVDAYSIDSIANGISKVFFQRDVQQKLSQEGLRQTSLFSWEKAAEETAAVYKSVVGY